MSKKKTNKNFAQQGVDDLVMLPKVNEEGIIDNLKKRYMNNIIYTNIGPVLISVNPYKALPITGEDTIVKYQGKFRHELEPHVFALAEETYRAMKSEGHNQCVIISGESGAGKTEASKLVMKYISYVSGSGEAVDYVKHVILESNPLLEAFGNAKTLRNNNSSRFGKYFEIHFDNNGDPVGGSITNYLLEKSRVTFQTPGERSFHVFYMLLSGASDAEANQWQLYSADNFFYLNQSGCYTADGIDDVKEYHAMRNAMNVINIPADHQQGILRLVAGILHIGNMTFHEDNKGNAVISDPQVLDLAAGMLGVEKFALQSAILFRVVNTGQAGGRQSTYNVPQNGEQAAYARDATAKAVYDRVFDYIVRCVNTALQKHKITPKTVIGVLDIFGFEIFEHNGFEQFCINYVNEKLQQFFIELTLKAEQEEYNQEGIKWEPIKYFNNQIVCDLIEGKRPPGLFSILDDVCYTIHAQSKGTDVKFLEKANGPFSSHLHYRGFSTAFSVKHYAGEVTYDVEGFCDKNKDTLFNDVIETLQMSNLPFLVSLFPDNTKDAASKKRPTTAGFKIKSSAQVLMKTLAACTPHYVRCIKPNETKQPLDWDHPRVTHQAKYLGLYENVRVRRAGFAYRAEFPRFLNRYKKLSRKTWGTQGEWRGSPQDGCSTLLQDLGLEGNQFQLGRTKVFIRYPETLFHMEELLERHDYNMASTIQRAWKRWKMRKHALEQQAKAADMLRGKKERQRDSVKRSFNADYIRFEDNFKLQEAIPQGESMLFADQILKLNRRGKPERRDFVLTTNAMYFAMRKKRGGDTYYNVTRRSDLSSITSVSMSTLQDNYVVVHCNDYDNMFELERKTEFVAVLNEQMQASTGREISLNFTDSITYKIKTGDTRIVSAQKNESASKAQLKKDGKNMTVLIASGLPKDTDTTPTGLSAARSGGGGGGMGRGGMGRGGGGGGAGRGGAGRGGAGAMGAGRGAGRGGGRGAGRGGGPPRRPQAKALYEYAATTADELSFAEGDVLFIVQKDDGGWWECELNGQKGWVPANYVQEM